MIGYSYGEFIPKFVVLGITCIFPPIILVSLPRIVRQLICLGIFVLAIIAPNQTSSEFYAAYPTLCNVTNGIVVIASPIIATLILLKKGGNR